MSTTDRELLELAAKAAGYRLQIADCGYIAWDGRHHFNWNPLTDDGDALRLAAKLGLHLFQSKHYVRCGRKTINTPIEESKRDQCPCAATRRAIVRAAAEIGEAMK